MHARTVEFSNPTGAGLGAGAADEGPSGARLGRQMREGERRDRCRGRARNCPPPRQPTKRG
jgi:hypothetical protein